MSCTTIPFDREVTSVPHAVNADHATSADSATTAASATSASQANASRSSLISDAVRWDRAIRDSNIIIESKTSSEFSVVTTNTTEIPIGKTGYTPLGVLGWDIGNNVYYLKINEIWVKKNAQNQDIAEVSVSNSADDGNTYNTTVTVSVLYIKTTFE